MNWSEQEVVDRLLTERCNLYKRLGLLSSKATQIEIKSAYHAKALETHPDQGGTDEGFCRVREAYAVLSNEESRGRYDAGFRAILSRAKLKNGPGRPAFDKEHTDRLRQAINGFAGLRQAVGDPSVNTGGSSWTDAFVGGVVKEAYKNPNQRFEELSGALRVLKKAYEFTGRGFSQAEETAWENVRDRMTAMMKSIK